MAHTTSESTALVELAWRLLGRGADDEEVIAMLRSKASGDLHQLRIAETEIRMSGFVAEQSHYYRCWSVLCAASGEDPERLPAESLRQTALVEEFLELSDRDRLERLESMVPQLERLFARVRGTPDALGDAFLELRRLIGPKSGHVDQLLRSRTAEFIVETELARVAVRKG